MRQNPNSIKSIVPQVLDNPVGIDTIVKDIQSAMDGISWLEKSFNRAVLMSRVNLEEETEIFPKCFVSNSKDEINMVANDNWQSYSFMVATGSETPLNWVEFEDSVYQRDLNLYVWVNLVAIDDTTDGNQLFEELKQDVKVALRSITWEDEYGIELNGVEDDSLTVFNDFTIDVAEKQNLHYPYRAIKFELTAVYGDKIICT